MFFSNIRRNKENILYVILTILCLEHVRVKYNKLEDIMREGSISETELVARRTMLLVKAGLAYGIFIGLIILSFFISITEKITNVYEYTEFLKHPIMLICEIIISYSIGVLVARILLKHYINAVNGWKDFWIKLGRSAWDGTKKIAKTPAVLGKKAWEGTKAGAKTIGKGVEKGVGATGEVSREIFQATGKTAKASGKVIEGINRVVARFIKGATGLIRGKRKRNI